MHTWRFSQATAVMVVVALLTVYSSVDAAATVFDLARDGKLREITAGDSATQKCHPQLLLVVNLLRLSNIALVM